MSDPKQSNNADVESAVAPKADVVPETEGTSAKTDKAVDTIYKETMRAVVMGEVIKEWPHGLLIYCIYSLIAFSAGAFSLRHSIGFRCYCTVYISIIWLLGIAHGL